MSMPIDNEYLFAGLRSKHDELVEVVNSRVFSSRLIAYGINTACLLTLP
jgi:hypothetical protein